MGRDTTGWPPPTDRPEDCAYLKDYLRQVRTERDAGAGIVAPKVAGSSLSLAPPLAGKGGCPRFGEDPSTATVLQPGRHGAVRNGTGAAERAAF